MRKYIYLFLFLSIISGIYAANGEVLKIEFNDGTYINFTSADMCVESTNTCLSESGGSYDLDVAGDSGTGTITNAETFTIAGAGTVTTAMSANTLTITGAASGGGSSKTGDNFYLYNDTEFMYFNETLLNATIDNRQNVSVNTSIILTSGYNSTQLTANLGQLTILTSFLNMFINSKITAAFINALFVDDLTTDDDTIYDDTNVRASIVNNATNTLNTAITYIDSNVTKLNGINTSQNINDLFADDLTTDDDTVYDDTNVRNSIVLNASATLTTAKGFIDSNFTKLNAINTSQNINDLFADDLSIDLDTNTVYTNSSFNVANIPINSTYGAISRNSTCITLYGSSSQLNTC